MTRRVLVFRGPEHVREVWFAMAERLRMPARSVAYRRRTGMWYGMITECALAGLAPPERPCEAEEET